jgi:hypothetical protein
MKNLISAVLLSLFTTFLISSCNSSESETKLSKKDRMDLAMEQEYEMTKDENGEVPREKLIDALEIMGALNKTTAAVPNITWTNLGPTNQAGRSKTMMVDANDASGNTVFCGSVGGGIWRTSNISSSSPNWQPINDFMQNLSITSLGQDPTNSMIMYAATGEPYGSSSSIRGLGVFKSVDGGSTWSQLASTTGADFRQCAKLTITSNGNVFVATTRGIFRSVDAGVTFTKVLSATSAGASSNRGHDIKQAANGDVYASLDGSLHLSTDNGMTWSPLTIGFNTERIEIACAPSNATTIYLLTEDNNAVDRIVKTTNGGSTWSNLSLPNDDDPGIPASDFSRGQAWYDLCIAVDPNDENVVLVGGIDLFKTTNGGSSWTQVSHWYGGFGHQEVHADQHFIMFQGSSSSEIYFCNDGGIYKTTNGTANVPTIASKGRNMITLQLYGCDVHPTNPYYLGGAQDNGSHRYTSNALGTTTEVTGGDGAFCNIDQDQPQFQFTQYVYNQYRRSTNGGTTFSNVNLSSSQGRFINPSDYDDVNNTMYAARNTGRYIRWNNPQTGSDDDNVNAGFSGKVSAVKVSPNVNNQVYFGDDDGNVYKVANAHVNSPGVSSISSGLPNNKYVSCIEVESGDENHLLVTYSNFSTNSVWESTNGGNSWTSVEGNLPDMPVRWAVFNPNNPDQVFLATELGVWSTDNLDGGNTNWGATNTGLANVRVDMIKINSNKEMIASTHGRGMFFSNSLNAPVNIPVTSITVSGQGNVTTINTMGGSLQMIANVLPTNATNPAVTWSMTNGTGSGTISATGLLTAITDGTVTVTATSTDGTNVSGSAVITISNQIPPVTDSIDVYGQGRVFIINSPNGQLQMIADLYPVGVSQNVVWNMLPGGTGAASLTATGLMTGLADGTVIVEATALDGSNVSGTAVITISEQIPLSTIDIELEKAVQLYPNPSSGNLFINAREAVKTVSVYSIYGRLIKQFNANEPIELRNLPKGNYATVLELTNGKRKKQMITLR